MKNDFYLEDCFHVLGIITNTLKLFSPLFYSDIYLFEPSTELILESFQFLNNLGNLWVWSWNDLKYLNFRREDNKISSPCQPPLFRMKKIT